MHLLSCPCLLSRRQKNTTRERARRMGRKEGGEGFRPRFGPRGFGWTWKLIWLKGFFEVWSNRKCTEISDLFFNGKGWKECRDRSFFLKSNRWNLTRNPQRVQADENGYEEEWNQLSFMKCDEWAQLLRPLERKWRRAHSISLHFLRVFEIFATEIQKCFIFSQLFCVICVGWDTEHLLTLRKDADINNGRTRRNASESSC